MKTDSKTIEISKKIYSTHSKHVQNLATAYILNAIDCSGYDIECNTAKEKLQFLADTFKSEYCYPENLRYYGSKQKTFENWLRGLPSSFNIDFENYRIIEIAKEWQTIPQNASEKLEDKVLGNWWALIYINVNRLMRDNNINF